MIEKTALRGSNTAVPLALALLLSTACGGGDDAPRAATDAGPTAAETAPTAPAAAPEMDADGPAAAGTEAARSAAAETSVEGELPLVRVWKAPTCGCCGDWVEHVRAAGFPVEVHDVETLTAVKQEHGIAAEHRSCHTATVDGYVVEGHVPADLIRRMIEERPEIRGLAVPGMPVGSPGMEVGDRKDPYDVLALLTGGSVVVYDSR